VDHIPEKYLEFSNKNEVISNLNDEFNAYLETCNYYPSMYIYVNSIGFSEYIQVNDQLLKSGTLIFIKEYDQPIMGIDNKPVTSVDLNDVKTLKYNINKLTDKIDGVDITKNKLRFNLLLLDDSSINQMKYHNDNKSKVNIRLVKSTHLENLAKYMRKNKYSDFLIVDKI
jgi:hypothetical protein